jgi:hypothetical protein
MKCAEAAVVLALCVSAARASWSMYGGDAQHTGRSAFNGPRGTPSAAWVVNTSDAVYASAVVADDGTVFVASQDYAVYSIASNVRAASCMP